ncbi:MAG TPA: hypothetical protein VN420_01980 [Candidatus Fimivivens sp.]|nr:hypothetical protein [Candidatus Fimivivens sp.]
MKKRTAMRRAISFATVAALVIGQSFVALTATAISIPSATKVMSDMEKRYHLNAGAIQNYGEGINVSGTKLVSPEVSLYFSPSDPKDGQKISAKAFPIYFSNVNDKLYYTWMLKRQGCDIGELASAAPSYCNADGVDDRITVNDWKVTAMRILATDGADMNDQTGEDGIQNGFTYDGNTDEDGYEAEFGGGNKIHTGHDWCYLHDQSSGVNYELTPKSFSDDAFTCGSAGYIPACLGSVVNMGTDFIGVTSYQYAGSPSCENDIPTCSSGELARCINPAVANIDFQLTDTVRVDLGTIDPITGLPNYRYDPAVEDNMTCSTTSMDGRCFHLFAQMGGRSTSGDGEYGLNEERFWGTNPHDPDTADNGNKDEANIVGLGADTFTWNYQSGDLIGLVVEGSAMTPTKHDDSSMMTMWAFTGDGCRVTDTGSYDTMIKGYNVTIPSTDMTQDDIDSCLERDLVDPLTYGQGSAKKIELDVAATPENPINDQTEERAGDTVTATAAITNSARTGSEIQYTWRVEVSDNAVDGWRNITAALRNAGLLPSTTGNGLNTISIALNMDRTVLGGLAATDPIYLRITAGARENYNDTVTRSGSANVIVRVSNTSKKIESFSSNASQTMTGTTSVSTVSLGDPICNVFHPNPENANDASDNLDRVACRVMKNEIIGVRVDPAGLSNFRWTIDGKPLSCGPSVSADAACSTGNEAFFAVVGSPGTSINVGFEAVNIDTGRSVSLTRTFNIVEPKVDLETADAVYVWPRYLGQYVDLDGTAHDDYSQNFFEKQVDGLIRMQARFVPGFAGDISNRTWLVDGIAVPETTYTVTDSGGDPVTLYGIDYAAMTKPVGSVFNVSITAKLEQPASKRIALKDIWGIDSSNSDEIIIGKSVQVQNSDIGTATAADSGVKKFFAAVSGYVPPALQFAVRMILSGGLLLFTVGFLFSLIPEEVPVDRRRE